MPAGWAWCSRVVAGECCCRVLLPHLSPVVIDRIDRVDGAVVIAAHPRARGSRCRRCGRVSTRVHSRYRRQLADLPVSGRPVEVWTREPRTPAQADTPGRLNTVNRSDDATPQ